MEARAYSQTDVRLINVTFPSVDVGKSLHAAMPQGSQECVPVTGIGRGRGLELGNVLRSRCPAQAQFHGEAFRLGDEVNRVWGARAKETGAENAGGSGEEALMENPAGAVFEISGAADDLGVTDTEGGKGFPCDLAAHAYAGAFVRQGVEQGTQFGADKSTGVVGQKIGAYAVGHNGDMEGPNEGGELGNLPGRNIVGQSGLELIL